LVTVTSAAATGAPDSLTTRPRTAPLPGDCAWTANEESMSAAKRRRQDFRDLHHMTASFLGTGSNAGAGPAEETRAA
jgi:hypothetical protein